MSLTTSPELFINMKSIPDAQSREYHDFFQEEKNKIEYGVTINGIYIPGWLYWHTNHWFIHKDLKDLKNGVVKRTLGHPDFRDNEWIIANAREEALRVGEDKKTQGLVIIGSRRLGKSELEASIIGRAATIYKGSENVVSGGNSPDIKLICDKLDVGLNNVHPYFRFSRIEDNWKSQVTLGIKESSGRKLPYSYIKVRNYEDGQNTEAAAGITAKEFIIDEALEENSLLYQLDGEIKIRDSKPGDQIYNDKGELVTITKKVNVGTVPVYNFTLSDGRQVRACGNHLWKVWDNVTKKYIISKTNELIPYHKSTQIDSRYPGKVVNKSRYSIPNNSPVKYKDQDLKIDPYYLGLWLGDGTKDNTSVCNIDGEVIEFIKSYALTLGLDYKYKSDTYEHILTRKKGIQDGGSNLLRDLLRQYNVFDNKHIPDVYLRASVEQRIALLQGLMDTDGCCDKNGHIEFVSTKKEIADGFYKLCRSLGIQVKVKKIKPSCLYKGQRSFGQEAWRFHLYTDLPVFRIQRKLDNYNKSNNKKMKSYKEKTSIIDISYIGDFQSYCIQVNTESGLFLTDNYTVTHNCGKFPFLRCLEAAIPAFTSAFGWRCSPLIVGTGGSFDKGDDAQKLFENPEAYNMLAIEVKDEPKKYGLFISGLYRMEGKNETSFGEFIQREKEIILPKESELFDIVFHEKDDEKALKEIQSEKDKAKSSSDAEALLKATMYYPLTTQDCFLNSSANFYDGDLARFQKARIVSQRITGTPVILKHNGENVIHEFTDDKPISSFPLAQGAKKDAPIVIWEFPIKDPPFGLYVAGVDPYRHSTSSTSGSLGAIYIFKRMHDIASEKYQDMFVASYVARPKTKEEWQENARNLIKFYNARTLCENDEMGFIEYMKAKGDQRYLEPQPTWVKSLFGSTVTREYGVHRSSDRIRNHLRSLFKQYMEEIIHKETDENGSTIKEIKGVNRILDPMLLEEISKWNEDDNYDREVAASLAIAMARHLDPIMGKMSSTDDKRLSSYAKNSHRKPGMFQKDTSMFANNIKRLFH